MLDTSAVISLTERGHQGVLKLITDNGATAPAVSVVTIGELSHGIEASNDSVTKAKRQSTIDMCDLFTVIDTDAAVARHYGLISAHVGKSGANDRWIAATAVATGRTLVTLDVGLAKILADRHIAHVLIDN